MIDLAKVKDDWGYNTGTATTGSANVTSSSPSSSQKAASSGESGSTGGNMALNATKLPQEWGQASDILGRLGSSNYFSPSGYNTAQNMAQNIWDTGGLRTSAQGIWNKLMPQLKTEYGYGLDKINETWGNANQGVSRGSGVQRAGAELWGNMMQNAASQVAQQQGAYDEAAASRMSGVPSLFANIAGAQSNDRNNWMSQMTNVANLLGTQGQRVFEAPAFAANTMMNLGNYQNQMAVDPWSQYLQSMIQQGAGASRNPSYPTSLPQNILSILGNPDMWNG